MPTLPEYLADHPEAAPRRKNARPERALQIQLRALCREHIAVRHTFAAHERSAPYGAQHIYEKEAGIVTGWPDVELCLEGGRTVRIELKAAGKELIVGSEQDRVARELNGLGHPTCWANSAQMFVDQTGGLGVPWRPSAMRAAQAIDAFLAEAARQRKVGKPKRASGPRKEPTNQRALGKLRRAGYAV
jgi:hypothetical protein